MHFVTSLIHMCSVLLWTMAVCLKGWLTFLAFYHALKSGKLYAKPVHIHVLSCIILKSILLTLCGPPKESLDYFLTIINLCTYIKMIISILWMYYFMNFVSPFTFILNRYILHSRHFNYRSFVQMYEHKHSMWN